MGAGCSGKGLPRRMLKPATMAAVPTASSKKEAQRGESWASSSAASFEKVSSGRAMPKTKTIAAVPSSMSR